MDFNMALDQLTNASWVFYVASTVCFVALLSALAFILRDLV